MGRLDFISSVVKKLAMLKSGANCDELAQPDIMQHRVGMDLHVLPLGTI